MRQSKHASHDQQTATSAAAGIHSMDNPVMSDAVYAMAFLGSLRPGEIGLANNQDQPLRCKDWTIHNPTTSVGIRFGTLRLHHRKNQQLGENCDVVIGITSSPICAVTAMEAYMAARQAAGEVVTPESYLFPVRESPSGALVPLSYGTLTKALDNDLLRAGFPANQYHGHSFRIGAATSMGLHGVPDYWIEDLGSWAPGSKAMRGYLHLSPPEARARMTAFLTRPYSSASGSMPAVYGPWQMAQASPQQSMANAAPESQAYSAPPEPVAERLQLVDENIRAQ
jgi:integrase